MGGRVYRKHTPSMGIKMGVNIMERTGTVAAVRGEWLEITFCRPTDCGKCNACLGGKSQSTLHVKGKAKVGDVAVVTMPEKTMLQASLLAYLLPLVGLLVGMIGFSLLLPGLKDLAAVIGAAVGLGLSLLIVRVTEARRKKDPAWQVQLVEVIPAAEEEAS